MEGPSQEILDFIKDIEGATQKQPRSSLSELPHFISRGAGPSQSWKVDETLPGPPGEPIHTEVWACRSTDGIWEIRGNQGKSCESSANLPANFRQFTADWIYPTVGLWKRLGSNRQSPFDQERKIWEVFLVKTNLIEDESRLSTKLSESILQSRRGCIASSLVRQFMNVIALSQRESLRIERECMILWRGKGAPVRNPHPILEEVVTAMSLNERFGLPTWTNVNDLHVKTYAVLKKVLECYSNIMNMNNEDERLRNEVAGKAGITRPRLFGA